MLDEYLAARHRERVTGSCDEFCESIEWQMEWVKWEIGLCVAWLHFNILHIHTHTHTPTIFTNKNIAVLVHISVYVSLPRRHFTFMFVVHVYALYDSVFHHSIYPCCCYVSVGCSSKHFYFFIAFFFCYGVFGESIRYDTKKKKQTVRNIYRERQNVCKWHG